MAVLRSSKIMFLRSHLSVLLLAMTLAVNTASAQGGLGQVGGTVTDAQSRAIRDAAVTLRNEGSGVTRNASTRADGRYLFPAVGPGRYTLIVECDGFAREVVTGLDVTIGFDLRRDFTLRLGPLTQTVVVTGAEPIVNTTTAETGGIITRQQIETLPVNSRQYLSLALLLPGTSLDATRPVGPSVNVGASMTRSTAPASLPTA